MGRERVYYLVACSPHFCRSRLSWVALVRPPAVISTSLAMQTSLIGFGAWRLGDTPLPGDGIVHRWSLETSVIVHRRESLGALPCLWTLSLNLVSS